MNIPIVENPNLKNPNPPAEVDPKNPPGWWNIANVRGTREGVLKTIAAARDIPDHWKTALSADIQAVGPEFNFFYVDAHCHVQGGKHNYHVTIESDKASL